MTYILVILCIKQQMLNIYIINMKVNITKLPTYGKIYKIIDFGRSIFNYNDITFVAIVLDQVKMPYTIQLRAILQ